MFTRKALVSALIAAGTLGALAAPLPGAAAGFDVFFDFGRTHAAPVRHYEHYHHYGHRPYYHHPYHYRYQPSRWDRDGDGIPNRHDPTPDGFGPPWDRDNDGIPNRYDPTPDGSVRMRDRDGDGVPDRFDNYPHDPRWR